MAFPATTRATDGTTSTQKPLFGLAIEDLREVMAQFNEKPYRAVQLDDALHRQRVESLDAVTSLSTELRAQMAAEGYVVGLPEIVQTARSVDGTERYLVRLSDGETVETVWMPGGDGGERGDGSAAAAEEEQEEATAEADSVPASEYKRATICVSSQVGCAVNCQFCLTAKLGIKRNLTAGEIAGQVAAVLNRHGVELRSGRGKSTPDRINLVFMGMGEPFLNYDNFMAAVRLLVKTGVPDARMTVSTSGIVPSIERFAQETVRPKLAVSLNASNNEVREAVMPITRKWNIEALLESLRPLTLRSKECVTFEYVLLGGVNDQLEHADEVIALMRQIPELRPKVNLIVWNPGPDIAYSQPKPEDVAAFQWRLREGGYRTYIRRPRGRDIYAACGQLKRTVDAEPQLVTIG